MKYLSCTFNEKNFIYSSLRSQMNLKLIDFLALDSTRESLVTLLVDRRPQNINILSNNAGGITG